MLFLFMFVFIIWCDFTATDGLTPIHVLLYTNLPTKLLLKYLSMIFVYYLSYCCCCCYSLHDMQDKVSVNVIGSHTLVVIIFIGSSSLELPTSRHIIFHWLAISLTRTLTLRFGCSIASSHTSSNFVLLMKTWYVIAKINFCSFPFKNVFKLTK